MTTPSPEEPYVRMQEHLRPHEQLLWAGRPEPGFHLSAGDVAGYGFAVVWTGFACFWEGTVLAKDAPLLFALWGVPFVLIGLNMLFVRPVREHRTKLRTLYAVTDQRAMAAWGASFQDVPLAGSTLDVSRSRDGRRARLAIGPTPPRTPGFVFRDIGDPDRVIAALDRARAPR